MNCPCSSCGQCADELLARRAQRSEFEQARLGDQVTRCWRTSVDGLSLSDVTGCCLVTASPAASLSPGTRLLREWQGQTHHVTVLASGFEYEGKVFRSLTAIARAITGMAWSGPLFFGLRA